MSKLTTFLDEGVSAVNVNRKKIECLCSKCGSPVEVVMVTNNLDFYGVTFGYEISIKPCGVCEEL